MPTESSVSTRLFAQWPAIAFAVFAYAVAVAVVAGGILRSAPAPLGQKFAVGTFLFFLLAAEGLALVLANGLLEALASKLHGKLGAWLDPFKALALTATIAVWTASLIKFRTIGIHLKSSDFWFVWNSAAQLAQESSQTEKATALKLGVGSLLLFLILWGLFAWRRSAGRSDPQPTRLAALLALTIAGAWLCFRLYPIVPAFSQQVVPEVHWASNRLAPDPFKVRASTASDDPSVVRFAGPPIAPYVVPESETRRMNVVLVMLESVPWSRAPWIDGREHVMPNVYALSEESQIFERAYTTSTHSDYAQMAILSSLYPRKYDQHDYYTDLDYPRVLVWDALSAAGYSTAMFSCQNERWGNMIQFLDTPGLEIFRHSLSWPDARHKGTGAESKVYEETPVREWQRWRERGQEPYFTYLNFQSNHFSYEVPPEAERPYAPHEVDFPASFVQYPRDKVEVMSNRFDNALRYADHWIGEVVDTLKESGEWDRTVFVVVSDHGEAFYEHEQPTHGTALFEEQVRSLWMMRVPGLPGRTIESPVSLLDVVPSLLEVLGLPAHGNLQGRGDVLAESYDGSTRALPFTIQGLTREDGILYGDWKFTMNWDRRTRGLYDLANDPGEAENLADRYPGQASQLQHTTTQLIERQLGYYAERLWEEGYYPPRLDVPSEQPPDVNARSSVAASEPDAVR